MDDRERKALESAGWVVGDVQDFLGLTDDEMRVIDCPARQGTHDFTFILDAPELTDDLVDRIYGAGCDDTLLSIRGGIVRLHFTREGPSLREAVMSALRDLSKIGVEVLAIKVDEDMRQARDREHVGDYTSEEASQRLKAPEELARQAQELDMGY